MDSIILAIESSCDDTSAAVIRNGHILSNVTATQAVHTAYGGVVPELASRAHQSNIIPIVSEALIRANIHKSALNAVAFTQGPGLLGALLVGTSFAKAMAIGLGIPLITVNHMQAHILAHFIEEPRPEFPFLCLTVSGGHTEIVLVKSAMEMDVIGRTQDDAAGEAFDKTAKLLGLPYPGGPQIDQHARTGDANAYRFPGTDMPGLDFSFSGIKTAFMYFLRKAEKEDPGFITRNMADICASIQHTIIGMLMKKLMQAASETGIKNIGIAGGVSANSGLRETLIVTAGQHNWNVFIPDFEYCTDNAAMIAMAAHYKYLANDFSDLSVSPKPRMAI